MSKRSNQYMGRKYPGAVFSWKCDYCGQTMGASKGRVMVDKWDYCAECVSAKKIDLGLGSIVVRELSPDVRASIAKIADIHMKVLLHQACSSHSVDCVCVPCLCVRRTKLDPEWPEIEAVLDDYIEACRPIELRPRFGESSVTIGELVYQAKKKKKEGGR